MSAPISEFALSVVVCTSNNAALLAETLDHLRRQEVIGAEFEVLVIDNNCTDETPRVVEQFNPSLAHLRHIVEPRQGQMHARLRGVRESRAEWIAFVDDDNWLEPGWITAALRLIAAEPRCDAFGGKVVIDWEEEPPAVIARRDYAYAATDLGPAARRLTGDERWKLRGAGLVCRKAALDRCGWRDWQACVGRAGGGTMAGDDTEIVMRLARAGGELWYEPACQLRHRISRRRLTWKYLRSLHVGFACSDPLLLAFQTRGSLAGWAGRFALLLLRRAYWLMRHGLRGLRDPDARATAILSFDTLRGALRGLSAILRMDRAQRRAWLGEPEPRTNSRRVLHIQNGRLFGGIERMLVCLAVERSVCPEMEPVFALCFSEHLATELKATGARVELLGPVRMSRPWQWVRAVWRLKRLLTREKFAAVVCHGSWSLALFGFCAHWRGLPLVLWMHNDTKVRNKNFFEFMAGRSQPQLVIANSAFTAASLPLLFPQPPSHIVLPCPVSRPKDGAHRRSELRAELSTPGNAVVVVLAGRPEPWKGHAELLSALARLRDHQEWVCWIVGGAFTTEQTEFLEQLKAHAHAEGIAERVRFIGQRDDVPALLAAADLFCQPNVTPEPFGIVFIEALYAGLPVVTTAHGSGAEIVNESCGRLVPPSDPAALANTLSDLIRNAALRLSLSSRAAARGLQISDPALVLPALRAALVALVSTTISETLPAPDTGELHLSAHG